MGVGSIEVVMRSQKQLYWITVVRMLGTLDADEAHVASPAEPDNFQKI